MMTIIIIMIIIIILSNPPNSPTEPQVYPIISADVAPRNGMCLRNVHGQKWGWWIDRGIFGYLGYLTSIFCEVAAINAGYFGYTKISLAHIWPSWIFQTLVPLILRIRDFSLQMAPHFVAETGLNVDSVATQTMEQAMVSVWSNVYIYIVHVMICIST